MRVAAQLKTGIVHLNKPSNLLVSPQGRLHLTDFGLARVLCWKNRG